MTQPYQYDPSQQPGQPSQPFDPAQQPAAPFDPGQQPPPEAAGTQPPVFQSGQAAAQPFGPSNEPPMFPPPSGNFLPQEPKKSKGGLFIVLSIVVVLIIGGGIGVAIWRPWAPASGDEQTDSGKQDGGKDDGGDGKDESDDDKPDEDSQEGVPSQVVDDAWHAADWNEAKGYMCEKLVTELEDSGAAEKYQPIGSDEEFKTTGEEIDGDKATVSVETTVTSDSGEPQIGKLEVGLVKEESDWKICEIKDVA